MPLSETNLKKAAEESMSKFSSHKTKPDFSSSRGNNRFADDYDTAKKQDMKTSSRFANASDSEDEFLFNRKKYTKENDKSSFAKYGDSKPGLSLSSRSNAEYSVKPYGGGLKPFGTSKNRVSEESEDEGRTKGFSSERNRVRRTSYEPPKKTSDMYRNSSTDVRNFRANPNGQSRDEMARKKANEIPEIGKTFLFTISFRRKFNLSIFLKWIKLILVVLGRKADQEKEVRQMLGTGTGNMKMIEKR